MRRWEEHEVSGHQRRSRFGVRTQEASAARHHQGDALVSGELQRPRLREFQPAVELPFDAQEPHYFRQCVHYYQLRRFRHENKRYRHRCSCPLSVLYLYEHIDCDEEAMLWAAITV